ncbi:class I SAM-dependent methyltransferase [Paenibacillus sp. N1-5-1-14]|uniref:class I SAM-dependent methyltransferase n=1 Tax=Paenibacillus radicibacter TaxID=2972488 RepID=UPI002158B0C7|nr:class I SAM-dependent methyltransferase [Paenibacillus radicibacter]MCR8644112.1 class I SAM-dependent methyltransferase [Paenibacillus radicibacter]
MDHRIKEKFNAGAQGYDGQRCKLIPGYDDFYGIATRLATSQTISPKVLDLGAGTGLMSAYVMEKYPQGTFTLVDLSEGMLNQAKQRFDGNSNVQFLLADYTELPFEDHFDIIVSSLSIHHLEHDKKQHLFSKIFAHLRQGGVFINADQVEGPTSIMDSLYKQQWEQDVRSTDLSLEAIEASIDRRVTLDRNAPLGSQLSWLLQAGFIDVDCVYKSYGFAVFYAKKPE